MSSMGQIGVGYRNQVVLLLTDHYKIEEGDENEF